MNNDKKKLNPLDQAIDAMRRDEAPGNVVEAAASRVWSNISGAGMAGSAVRISSCEDVRVLLGAFRAKSLSAERTLLVEDHLHECVGCRLAYQQDTVTPPARWKDAVTERPTSSFWNPRRFAIAASLLGAVALSGFAFQWFLAPLPGDRAHLQSASGPVYLIASNAERPLL